LFNAAAAAEMLLLCKDFGNMDDEEAPAGGWTPNAEGLSQGVKIGIGVGLFLAGTVFVTCCCLGCWWLRRKKSSSEKGEKGASFSTQPVDEDEVCRYAALLLSINETVHRLSQEAKRNPPMPQPSLSKSDFDPAERDVIPGAGSRELLVVKHPKQHCLYYSFAGCPPSLPKVAPTQCGMCLPAITKELEE
jgi:hypothetical protein